MARCGDPMEEVVVVVLVPTSPERYRGASVMMTTILRHLPLLYVIPEWYGVDSDHHKTRSRGLWLVWLQGEAEPNHVVHARVRRVRTHARPGNKVGGVGHVTPTQS